MRPAPLTPQPEWHHLPKLPPEFYRGFAAVQWTITFEHRVVGQASRLSQISMQTSDGENGRGSRPPRPGSCEILPDGDRRDACPTLRAARSPSGVEFELQKQPHDSVLREADRTHGALAKSCFYLLDNPRVAGLVEHPRNWPYLGAVVPGYPFLHPLEEDFWPLFWRFYAEHRELTPTDPLKPSAQAGADASGTE